MPRQRHKPESRAPVWREREKTLAWEGEPVLTYTVKALALPTAPARLERYYRRMARCPSGKEEVPAVRMQEEGSYEPS